MTPRSRTALANDAWERLFKAQARLLRQFEQEPVWGTLSMREYDVLYTLVRQDAEAVRLGDLAEQVYMPQPSLSRMVDRLVRRGLLNRVRCAGDKRGVEISLTEAGRQAQIEVGRAHGRSVATTMMASLSDDELIHLRDLCTKLIPDTTDSNAHQEGNQP